MRISVNPKGFSDINTAVFYRFNKFIPDIEDAVGLLDTDKVKYLGNFISDKVMLKGSKNSLSLNTFIEYDFKYQINKDKFGDAIIPNLFTKQTQDLLGLEGLNTVSENIFPTVISTNETYEEKYFGSCMINEKTVIVLEALGIDRGQGGVWVVELYEEENLEKNNNLFGNFTITDALKNFGYENSVTNFPAVTIILGPDPLDKNNIKDYYLPIDTRQLKQEDITSLKEYEKSIEEITCDKLITTVLSQNSSSPEINLSYKAWSMSNNPNRNMNKYLLRNDEFYSTRRSLRVISKSSSNSDLWVDNRSGTLIGNKLLDSDLSPILSHRLKKTKEFINSKANYPLYSPFRCYSLGEIVEYGGKYWESLEENNLGNSPVLGVKWIEKKNIESIFTNRILVSTNDDTAGRIIPGGYITITKSNESKVFEVIENLGYQLREDLPALFNPSSGVIVPRYSIRTSVVDGRTIKRIIIDEWTGGIKYGLIEFQFEEVGCSVNLTLKTSDGYLASYEEWGEIFDEPALEITNGIKDDKLYISCDGKKNYFKSRTENYTTYRVQCSDIPVSSPIIFNFPELKKYQPSKLTMSNTLGEEVTTVECFPEKLDNGDFIFQTTSDFVSSEWVVELIGKILYINIISEGDFEFSTPRGSVNYGSSNYILEFYCLDETKRSSDWTVLVNDQEIIYGKPYANSNVTINYSYNNYRDVYYIEWTGFIENNYTVKIIEK